MRRQCLLPTFSCLIFSSSLTEVDSRRDSRQHRRTVDSQRPWDQSVPGLFCCLHARFRTTTMSDGTVNTDRVIIFDTTLRDGEQSPGASMNLAEKLEVAKALADLGVDIIEAGFPIASPRDFESVQAIARQVEGPVICGLARCN